MMRRRESFRARGATPPVDARNKFRQYLGKAVHAFVVKDGAFFEVVLSSRIDQLLPISLRESAEGDNRDVGGSATVFQAG